MTYYLCPIPDLTVFAAKAVRAGKDSIEVTYPVSHTYLNDFIVGDEVYRGYDVPAPIIPPGWKLVDIKAPLRMGCRPPHATMLMKKER